MLQVGCEECKETFSIPTSKRIKTNDGRHWEVNLGAVLGQMMTGGGAHGYSRSSVDVQTNFHCNREGMVGRDGETAGIIHETGRSGRETNSD